MKAVVIASGNCTLTADGSSDNTSPSTVVDRPKAHAAGAM